ncbi:hypothetical protein PTKIN_Ptkin07bG0000900 [Pterospermum kingtungense]
MRSIADELEVMWNKFSIEEKDDEEVVIESSWVKRQPVKNCLLGKMVMPKPYHIKVMPAVFQRIWHFQAGLSIHDIEAVDLGWCPFWICILGLPIGTMNAKIGIVIGESIGEILEVDQDDNSMAWGQCLHVRVLLNVHKPLRCFQTLSMMNGKKLQAKF